MLSGFGVGLRTEFLPELLASARHVDWLEIIAENWLMTDGLRRRDLECCAERWPLVPHGVSMSIGGVEPLDAALFREVTRLCREVEAPFWSDHLCCAVIEGTYFNDLLPLPHSDAVVEHVLQRIRSAGAMTDVPLVFENPTFYVELPGSTMSASAFLKRILIESGAGLLLDITNVYVNSQNHGFDPDDFVDDLPLPQIRQIHLAGYTTAGDTILDTHAGPVSEAVWSLYRRTVTKIGDHVPTLIEWDSELPGVDRLADELDRARLEETRALAGAAAK